MLNRACPPQENQAELEKLMLGDHSKGGVPIKPLGFWGLFGGFHFQPSILRDFAEAKLIPGGICLLPNVCKEGKELLGEATPQIPSAESALDAAPLRRGCQNTTSAE